MSPEQQIIYQNLTGDNYLTGRLAQYAEEPAIFENWAPESEDPDWGESRVPYIVFSTSRQLDQEKSVSGKITFAVIHDDQTSEVAQEIKTRLKVLLESVVYPDGQTNSCFRWNSEQLYVEEPDLRGFQVVFDLIMFPPQMTLFTPDPIAALNKWTTKYFSELKVGQDIWCYSNQYPALYWRLDSHKIIEEWQTVVWLDATIKGHVIAPHLTERNDWLTKIDASLSKTGEIILDDDSPLFIQTLTLDPKSDHVRQGQIGLTVKFGVLKPDYAYEELKKAYTGQERLK